MVERLTVIFFIILCLLLGSYLILSPWDALFGPWAENYLLVFNVKDYAVELFLHFLLIRMRERRWLPPTGHRKPRFALD